MLISPATVLENLTRTSNALDVALPAAVVDAYALCRKVRANLDEALRGQADLRSSLIAALTVGRNPFTDKAVAAAVNAEFLNDRRVNLLVESGLDDALSLALDQHRAAIVEAWQERFDRDAAALVDAAQRLGTLEDLNEPGAIAGLTAGESHAWAEAREANHAIEQLVGAWLTLMQATRGFSVHHGRRALIFISITPSEWLEDLPAAALTPWEAVRRGYRLRLASPNDYAESNRLVDLEAQNQDRARRVAARYAGSANEWEESVIA